MYEIQFVWVLCMVVCLTVGVHLLTTVRWGAGVGRSRLEEEDAHFGV